MLMEYLQWVEVPTKKINKKKNNIRSAKGQSSLYADKKLNPCFFFFCVCVCVCVYIYTHTERPIGLVSRVFANGSGDQGSIPDWVISKTQKMVVETSLLNTQHYKAYIKGKVEQSKERRSTFPYCGHWKESLQVILDYSRQLY